MMRIIRAAERDHWRNEWLDSRQSFPATGNFDLAANAHGVLMVHNDDRVQAGEGLDTHQHRDAEILTWVVDGTLRHRDSHGNTGTLAPGMVQRMTAGRGIRHAEGNASSRDEDQPLRVIQMWVAPEFSGLEPGYAETDLTTELELGILVVIASGMPRDVDGPGVSIANSHAALHAARLTDGRSVTLPAAPFGHLFVVRGTVDLPGSERLAEGDAVRLTDHGEIPVAATGDAEILFWEMHTSFGRT